MYGGVERVGEEVVFAPRCAEDILIYNLKNKSITRIPYKTNSLYEGYRANQFVEVHFYGGYYFFSLEEMMK